MEMIKIYHPGLDDGRIVEVPEISLEHHLRGGWLRESDRPKLEESVPLAAEDLAKVETKPEQPSTTKKEGK